MPRGLEGIQINTMARRLCKLTWGKPCPPPRMHHRSTRYDYDNLNACALKRIPTCANEHPRHTLTHLLPRPLAQAERSTSASQVGRQPAANARTCSASLPS